MNVKKFSPDAVIPMYAKPGDAGFDIVATQDFLVAPGDTVLVPSDIGLEIPKGFMVRISPRSGISVNTKLRIVAGTIDAGYRGNIGVIVDNIAQKQISSFSLGGVVYEQTLYPRGLDDVFIEEDEVIGSYYDKTYLIRKGDRIAQGVLVPVGHTAFTEVDELGMSVRGGNGFGHSGLKTEASE